MVATAHQRHPGVAIDVDDATAMNHPDASFDAVTIGFCLHHTVDAAAVLREASRVLRPGGRIAYTVWAANDRLQAFGIAFGAVAELVPDLAASPQPPSIGDAPPDHERLLSDNGFVQPTARTLELTWALTDGEAIMDGFSRYLDLADQPDAIRRALRNRLDEEVARRAGTDGIAHIPNPAIIASARRSGEDLASTADLQ
jgi:SAM-dependent methyltransferase